MNFSSRNQAGMTLVEVIAVIFLLSLIMVVVVKNISGKSEAAQAKLNQVRMNTLQSYLTQYKLEFNTFPSQLMDLVRASSDVKNSGNIFTPLAKADEIKDVWGNDFVYTVENNGRSYVIKTLGSDGQAGGEGPKQDFEVRP